MSDPQNLHMDLPLEAMIRHIELSEDAVLLVDGEEAVVSCSLGLHRTSGWEYGQTVNAPASLFLRPGDSARSLYDNYIETPAGATLTATMKTSGGTTLVSRYWAALFQTADSRQNYYLLYFSDLQDNTGLTLLQRFAGTFMKDINLGVILIDTSFTLVDISDTACRVLGLDKNAVLNEPVDKVFASIPVEHQLVNRNILDGMVVRNHAVSWMNNQERYELLLDSNVLKDENGGTVGAYIIFKDVTNLRSLEEQVTRSDRLAMIGQIAAGTAHEIRNPLTSIKGFMQVLKNTFIEKGMEKEQDYTDIMLMEINRINELVSEFLLLSKRKDATYHEVEIKMALREILPIIHNQAILYGVNVQYEPAHFLPKVVADRELLKQVFLNLCKNGIEAMVDGGTLTITERVDYEERKVLVDIHDTGPGIPNFLIDKIFDPFFTTKESGTGLGLSVCQRIVHDMGGNIRVSTKGFGTTFTVCLPYP